MASPAESSVWHRLRFVLLALVLVLAVSACQVDMEVTIDADSNGSGEVEVEVVLDDEAVLKLPNLEEELRTEDLVAADWDISRFEVDEFGATIRAAKRYSSPEQLQQVLDEISGAQGMFRDFVITQEAEFAIRRFAIDGELDLRRGVGMLGDARLTELLGGELFGRPVTEFLDGRPIDDAVSVEVEVILPGEGDAGSGSRASWNPRFDDAEATVVSLQTVEENFIAQLLMWVARAAFALFLFSVVLGALAGLFRWNRKRKSGVATPKSVRGRVPGAAPGGPGAAGAPSYPAAPAAQVRLVCVDPLGVIYNMGADPVDLLVSFIRSRGSNVARQDLDGLHAQATLGRISTEEFWSGVGLTGSADDLDAAYIELIAPRNGAAEFLREMRRREVPVTAVTNDVSAWSRRLRERDNLAMIWPWVISADIGVRKPDPGIFEALRREAGVPYESCLLIDTNAAHLDTARTLGMSTAFFTSRKLSPNERPNHPVVSSFSDFFRRRG